MLPTWRAEPLADRTLLSLSDLLTALKEKGLSISDKTLQRRSDEMGLAFGRLNGQRVYRLHDVPKIARRLSHYRTGNQPKHDTLKRTLNVLGLLLHLFPAHPDERWAIPVITNSSCPLAANIACEERIYRENKIMGWPLLPNGGTSSPMEPDMKKACVLSKPIKKERRDPNPTGLKHDTKPNQTGPTKNTSPTIKLSLGVGLVSCKR